VQFVGRLATYKYYNMDQIVAQALTSYAKIAGTKRVVATAQGNGNAVIHKVQVALPRMVRTVNR
jgi:UDP-galactopyranose mutase